MTPDAVRPQPASRARKLSADNILVEEHIVQPQQKIRIPYLRTETKTRTVPSYMENTGERSTRQLTRLKSSEEDKPAVNPNTERTKKPIGKKFASMENGLDHGTNTLASSKARHASSEVIDGNRTRVIKTKPAAPKKEPVKRSDSADGLLERDRRVITVEKSRTEKKPLKARHMSNGDLTAPEVREEIIAEVNHDSNEKSNGSTKERIADKNDLGKSKLRFPLRTRSGPRQVDEAATENLHKVQAHIKPTVRDKENVRSKQNVPNGDHKPAAQKKKSTLTNGTTTIRRTSFRRRSSQGGNSGRRAKTNATKGETAVSKRVTGASYKSASPSRNKLMASAAISDRLDFKQMNDASHYHHLTHYRSASRDSVGSLSAYINTDAEKTESNKDSEETDGYPESIVDSAVSPTPTFGEMDAGRRMDSSRRTGKQNCSSLINTPSGISVMEDIDIPHRLPPPLAPKTVRMLPNGGEPVWTKNCATMLNYHK